MERNFFVFTVTSLLLMGILVYGFDLWMHFDGVGYFFETYFTQTIYNEDDRTRLAAVYTFISPLWFLMSIGQDKIELAIIFFNIGLSFHYSFPLFLGFFLYKIKKIDKDFFFEYLAFYIISLVVLRGFGLFWYISEINVAHTFLWMILILLKVLNTTRFDLSLLVGLILLTLIASNTHPCMIPAFTFLLLLTKKHRASTSLILFVGIVLSCYNLYKYLEIHAVTPHGTSLDHLSFYFLSENFWFQTVSFVIIALTVRANKYAHLIIYFFLLSFFVFLVNDYPYIYYTGRSIGFIFSLLFVAIYLVGIKVPNVKRVAIYFMFYLLTLTVVEGVRWKKDLNKVSDILKVNKNKVTQQYLLGQIDDYQDYANSWTQRMLSIILQAREKKRLNAIIELHPEEFDTVDFRGRIFKNRFKQLGFGYEDGFDQDLLRSRAK